MSSHETFEQVQEIALRRRDEIRAWALRNAQRAQSEPVFEEDEPVEEVEFVPAEEVEADVELVEEVPEVEVVEVEETPEPVVEPVASEEVVEEKATPKSRKPRQPKAEQNEVTE